MKITEVIQPIKPKTLDQIRIDQLTKVSTTAKDAVKRERKRQKIQKASATLQKLQQETHMINIIPRRSGNLVL